MGIIIKFLKKKYKLLKEKYTRRYIYNRIYPYNANYFDSYWDEIISLGFNCEVSARLVDIFGYNFNHFLFTWSYEYDRASFLNALNELGNFSNNDYSVLPWGMIQNNKYLIGFHSRYTKNELINDDKTLTPIVPLAIDELKSRVKHLAEKLECIFTNDKKVLFVIKLEYTNLNNDIDYISKLNELIKKKFTYKNPKYKLLVVISKNNYPNPRLLSNNLPKNVEMGVVNYFAADSNTSDGGDIIGWKKLLKKHIKCK